jgi:aldehyde dehydrogenase (NAD+)
MRILRFAKDPRTETDIRELVADAEARGGQVLKATRCNGSTLDDRTTFPRIVLNATPEMELCQVDSFAPIAAVIPFDTIEHALAMESACPMALGASIFTRDPSAAQKLATRLRAGSVSINDLIAPTAHPATPFGGRCASGWGVTRGEEGLIAMTTTQVVSTRGGQFRPHFGGATPALIGSLRGLLSWSHAPRFADRVRGMWTTVRGMFRIG